MNKSITQDNQNDNQISKSIRRFFTRFRVCQVKCVSFSKNISERDLRGWGRVHEPGYQDTFRGFFSTFVLGRL